MVIVKIATTQRQWNAGKLPSNTELKQRASPSGEVSFLLGGRVYLFFLINCGKEKLPMNELENVRGV
jgi:hypothetical protein